MSDTMKMEFVDADGYSERIDSRNAVLYRERIANQRNQRASDRAARTVKVYDGHVGIDLSDAVLAAAD